MSRLHYAHTLPGRPSAEWQLLQDHLRAVAGLAASHAAPFGAQEWGYLAGLWHDLGKYSAAFQSYLSTAAAPDPHQSDLQPKTDHSTAGAQHAVGALGVLGHLLAFPVAGHHAGLLDSIASGACLQLRLGKTVADWGDAPDAVTSRPSPRLPRSVVDAFARRDAFSIAFFVRMVFSCLVDADFLDTEAFMSPKRSAERIVWPADVLSRIEGALAERVATFSTDGPVNAVRAEVRGACVAAADARPGLFSLTVPTGGGKTLSSLAFALRHAVVHGQSRVIYVVPFTSIIEQNAEEFRRVVADLATSLPADPVVEHHSNFEADRETVASRVATENWDAPIVVTTSVQFYESLFANRTSRCRKLHNIANSVVILDEVQTLPVDYLAPCLGALRELADTYRTTIVLCTATQPTIGRGDHFPIGLDGVREIVPDPTRAYSRLKRVDLVKLGPVTDTDLAARLREHEQVLCIVNTRKHARRLFEFLESREGDFHLSALMCAEHRANVLERIRARLDSGEPCRVVSTQLIEAGVDIDFPVVYRSLAGLDSIAQAAGRCNRNGRQALGKTFVFESEHSIAERFLADTANCARQVLPDHDDLLSPEAVEHFFRLYFWDQSARWDAKLILRDFDLNEDENLPFLFAFASAAERFKIIDEPGVPVIIPWRERGAALCGELEGHFLPPTRARQLLRRLQRYIVTVPVRTWRAQLGGAIDLVHDRYSVLAAPNLHYSEELGLDLDRDLTTSLIY